MSRGLQWIIGIGVTLAVIAVVFSAIWPILAPGAGWTGYSMMGPGHMLGGRGMLGGWGMPFLGLGMLVGPLLVTGLIVIGAVWLVRMLGTPGVPQSRPTDASQACAQCSQPLQAGWKACPYCGEKI